MVLDGELVGGDAHVERVRLGPALALGAALLGRAEVGEQLEAGTPLLELHLPVEQHRRGHDDQVRAPDLPLARQVREQRDRLDRLAEAHLVREDAVQVALVHRGQPAHAHQLVLAEITAQQLRHRHLHLLRLGQRPAARLHALRLRRQRLHPRELRSEREKLEETHHASCSPWSLPHSFAPHNNEHSTRERKECPHSSGKSHF